MVNPTGQDKCAHNACSCTAPIGEGYCGAACEKAATSGPPREEAVCPCEHDGCAGHR